MKIVFQKNIKGFEKVNRKIINYNLLLVGDYGVGSTNIRYSSLPTFKYSSIPINIGLISVIWFVGVGVGLPTGVCVGVCVGVSVTVGVGVSVFVIVGVGVGVSVLVDVTDGEPVGVGVTVGNGVLSIYVLPSPYTTISQSVFPLDGVLEMFGLNETYTTFSYVTKVLVWYAIPLSQKPAQVKFDIIYNYFFFVYIIFGYGVGSTNIKYSSLPTLKYSSTPTNNGFIITVPFVGVGVGVGVLVELIGVCDGVFVIVVVTDGVGVGVSAIVGVGVGVTGVWYPITKTFQLNMSEGGGNVEPWKPFVDMYAIFSYFTKVLTS